MLKKALRSEYMARRQGISPEALSNYSIRIVNNLLELPIWSFDYYHLFLTIVEKREVDTHVILSILQGKDKNIVLPKMSGKNTLTNYLLTDSTVLKTNRWGVPEPVEGLEVPPHKIDVVFIPLLAFDASGNRIGYGKGYYDSFLKECRPDVLKIGLSIFEAETAISDLREEDIAMNYCVTPDKTYSF
ncbi:5-formyltetrahydrofolate cyclo-ligase [Flavobacteriaceae bacterium F89]|uniref:5-formyltetrahydrofolate cyclo-ligase n=1 Tax=Cerina litoralis TaxID=2874477 RepID=A0AAE3JMQ1_9FLAO|nr:5-formyltetrahydrofolate cyclo-ligase [Cerina litoralis]MCG2460125.1 5-formyltetrahydrofolate cyclo-ligase [Cerina litoralis]